MAQIPCKECVCIPVCKRKNYFNLMLDCDLVAKYTDFSCLYGRDYGKDKLFEVETFLGSTGFRTIPEIKTKGLRKPK